MYFSQINHVIIDEVDTMLTQGFGSDIRAILRAVMQRNAKKQCNEKDHRVHLVMATATLTKAVRSLLTDVQGGFNIEYSGTPFSSYLVVM